MNPQPVLKVTDLQVEVLADGGPFKAVNGVSLQVNPGEIVGLIGESGCGKSMTARAIMQLLPSSAEACNGSVQLLGEEVLGIGEKEFTKRRGSDVAMVFQDPMSYLNPVMKIKNQISEAARLFDKVGRDEADLRALEILEDIGLGDSRRLAESYPHELSGGMRQRVLLGIALARRPALLIADEPFTAVDVSVQDGLIQLLKREQRNLGFSCLMITHDLTVSAELCDRIYVMYAGEVVESGDVWHTSSDPQHPYTEALLAAATLDEQADGTIPFIAGDVPSLMNPPSGCRFHPRCHHEFDPCSRESPPKVPSRHPGEWSRCWLRTEQVATAGGAR